MFVLPDMGQGGLRLENIVVCDSAAPKRRLMMHVTENIIDLPMIIDRDLTAAELARHVSERSKLENVWHAIRQAASHVLVVFVAACYVAPSRQL